MFELCFSCISVCLCDLKVTDDTIHTVCPENVFCFHCAISLSSKFTLGIFVCVRIIFGVIIYSFNVILLMRSNLETMYFLTNSSQQFTRSLA